MVSAVVVLVIVVALVAIDALGRKPEPEDAANRTIVVDLTGRDRE